MKKRWSGFTLTEVLLAVSVLMLVSGAAVFSLNAFKHGAALNTGTVRFESVLRMARATAANTGRRVRVTLMPGNSLEATNQLNKIQLSWEPKPLEEPEIFRNLPGHYWGLDQIDEYVEIGTVRLVDSNSGEAQSAEPDEYDLTEDDRETEETPQSSAITFNPDGSCDSAEITLIARDTEDTRRATVRVEGFTGSISHRLGSGEEVVPIEECPEQAQFDMPAQTE